MRRTKAQTIVRDLQQRFDLSPNASDKEVATMINKMADEMLIACKNICKDAMKSNNERIKTAASKWYKELDELKI